LIAIVDAGPLLAALDVDDRDHVASVAIMERADLELVVPTLVVSEVCYFAGRRLGASVEAEFLRSMASFEVLAPLPEDWPLIANLVERYSDFPLGGTDASVAVLAERLGTDLIVTLDRRHFGAIRMSDGRPFRFLPE
jgi:predicted nucleic acid-binding protein